jgi:hypothetical protein
MHFNIIVIFMLRAQTLLRHLGFVITILREFLVPPYMLLVHSIQQFFNHLKHIR